MDHDGYSQQHLDDLYMKMIEFDKASPERIQHLTKVHSFARFIGIKEGLDDITQFILEAAAYTHDIGIRIAEEKYGKSNGKLQEQEGPVVAQQLLSELGFENYQIERVCYLIGNHHTYDNIDGMDYRILVEADFLVNLYENNAGNHAKKSAYRDIFETETGKWLFRTMFGFDED